MPLETIQRHNLSHKKFYFNNLETRKIKKNLKKRKKIAYFIKKLLKLVDNKMLTTIPLPLEFMQ